MLLPEGVKITPWLAQYVEWKDKYPDYLLFFRMGDFYELFFDDAKILSRALNLTLTSRDATKSIPMAGVPHHALNIYLRRTMKLGFKVAICEQIGEPDGHTLVPREVNRLITPGTYVPEESENTGRLAAFSIDTKTKKISLALLSAETGRLEVGEFSFEEAIAILSAFSPLELLHPQSLRDEKVPRVLSEFNLVAQPNENFKIESASKKLCSLWGVASLSTFGCDDRAPYIGTMNAVIEHLAATQFGAISHVRRCFVLQSSNVLCIDSASQASLELVGDENSLFSSLNFCSSPMGRRTLKSWILRPLTDANAIIARQNRIKNFVENLALLETTREHLVACRDVERAVVRLSGNAGNERDLLAIKETLNVVPNIKGVPDAPELRELLNAALNERGDKTLIRDGFDKELDELRGMSERGEVWLEEYIERERADSGIPKLKLARNNLYGYFIELSKAAGAGATMPAHFSRRQTMVNAERYITEELKNFEEKITSAEGEISRVEREIYLKLVERVRAHTEPLQALGSELGSLDCLCSLAKVAWERNYVMPGIADGGANDIVVRLGRHPVLEAVSGEPFVPNNVVLTDKSRVVILTGPNMAGKSTWLKMTALLCIMAQMGSFVPAAEASFGITDRIFTRIGARDDISRGNSTFMIEMLETANILNNVTKKSLVILDEVGRGTATWDGMSIAWAVLEHLHHLNEGEGCKVLFATHYHELTVLGEILDGATNLSMDVSESGEGEGKIVFRHQVVPGAASRSYGIEVARLAGLPKDVLVRARELLRSFEKNRVVVSLPHVQKSLFD